MNELILKSYAKVNLYLEVLNARPDNYHNIKTIFERIDLCDKIVLTLRRDKLIKITCSHPDVPEGKTNLAYTSAKLLQDYFKIEKGVEIKITKRIPVASGLAGGSSNAAAVLLGLNKIWKLNLKRQALLKFARKIGADVAFFLYNASFAQGCGRGDKIKPVNLQRVRRFWHVLVVPGIRVRTPLIYKKWDELGNLVLTRPKCDVNILISALRKGGVASISKLLFNSLEEVTARLFPEIRRVKERLSRLGLESVLMSGSGPAVFAILPTRKEALSLCRRLKRESSSWQVFVARTL